MEYENKLQNVDLKPKLEAMREAIKKINVYIFDIVKIERNEQNEYFEWYISTSYFYSLSKKL